MTSLLDHLSRCVASALARQEALTDLLKDRDWAVNIDERAATFGDDLRFAIQLLGTEGEGAGTWLWAWANSQSNIPPDLLGAANWLRDYGQQHGIAELTEAEIPLDRADGHMLAMLANGLTRRCYYRGPYPGGALFFLIEDLPDPLAQPISPARVVSVLGQALQLYPVDHRVMVESFFGDINWAVTPTADGITGRSPGGSAVVVSFDSLGRVSNIEGELRNG